MDWRGWRERGRKRERYGYGCGENEGEAARNGVLSDCDKTETEGKKKIA